MSNDFIHKYPYSNLHELNLDWLIDQTKDSMARIKTLEDQMAEIVIVTKDQIEIMISEAIATNNIYLLNQLQSLHNEITNEYTTYVNGRINQLTLYIDNQDAHYDTLAQNYAAQAKLEANQYTDDKVLNYTMMINPITGQYEDVRDVVNDIVSYFHTENALTAGEYDALDLTADDYDAYQLTAYDYDFNGKIRLT